MIKYLLREYLIALFAGKRVRITHTNPRVTTDEGTCKTIHTIPGSEDEFDLELEDGSRYGFVPEIITSDSVDGELRAFAGGRRKIQIVPRMEIQLRVIALMELYVDREVTLCTIGHLTNLARSALLSGEWIASLIFSRAAQQGLEELDGINEQIGLTEQALGLL